MVAERQVVYETQETKIFLNPDGLSAEELVTLAQVAQRLFEGSTQKFKYALDRCTFFADTGYDVLVELIPDYPTLTNPQIEGCDNNPFDQHYWLSADLANKKASRKVIFDPIFGYVGLAKKTQNQYYDHKRIVTPHELGTSSKNKFRHL